MSKILKALYSIYVMLLFVVIILLCTPFVFIILLLPEPSKSKAMHYLLLLISRIWLWGSGIITITYNRHLFTTNKHSIIVPNHSSYLDAPIVYTIIPQMFKSLGKIEVARMPIFGLIYKTTVVLIDRSSTMASARSMLAMITVVKQGLNMLVFPEGTFTDEPTPHLLPFKDGAFKLAIDSGTALLPLLLLDSSKRMYPSSVLQFTPGICRSVVLPSIPVSGLSKQHTSALNNYVHRYMSSCYAYCQQHPANTCITHAQQWLQQHPFSI
jgi:1-acyl-sn-glycerol-3-phosphate acyltransferase